MDDRAELAALRRLAELEAKASGAPAKDYKAMSTPVPVDPTADMGMGEKFAAGAGKAFTDIGRGAAQLFGGGPSAEEVRNQRELDKPLMKTASGLAGNVMGNVTAFAPLAVIPGGATVGGAGALGATMAGLQPTETAADRLTNMAVGTALGAGGQWAGTSGASKLGEHSANKARAMALLQSQNAERDATLKAAQGAGYVVPPSAVNPSATNRILESVAGKAAVGQDAAIRNQAVTNDLARKALGLPEGTALSEKVLTNFRNQAAQPYREVAGMSSRAKIMLEQLKDARFKANQYSTFYDRSADPSALAAAQNFGAKAQQLEQQIEGIAQRAGKTDLVAALRDARTQIAKSYDIERALNLGTGDVSAPILGRALDRGKPLSGELETIGRFAESFRPYAREGATIPTPGVSKSGALSSVLFGGGGAAAGGPVGAAVGATVPFVVPPAARNLVLSSAYQKAVAQPQYPKAINEALARALRDGRAGGMMGQLAAPAAYLAGGE